MAFFRAGRPAGHSDSWTSSVPPETWAPRAFRSALRAQLHARVTRSTVCAGRAAGQGLLYAQLDQVTRAYGGAPGLRPPAFCRHVGVPLIGLGDQRLPAPPCPISTSLGRGATPGAIGSFAFAPPAACGLGWLPFIARLQPGDCAPKARRFSGTDCCQTVRVVAAAWPRLPAPAHGICLLPSEFVAHLWRPSPWPTNLQGPAALSALLLPLPAGLRPR